jgi:predicted nucleic acid-binding protein
VKKSDSFWDSSALVPLCANRSSRLLARTAFQSKSVTVLWGTPVEMRAALCRLLRDGHLSRRQFESAISRLEALRQRWVEVAPTQRVREVAETLLERHALRAADALQLAAALVWAAEHPRQRQFVCFDRRLAEAAEKEGFQVAAF